MPTPAPQEEPLADRLRHFVFGKPRDLADKHLFHRLALIPFLAWVGLGADGLSSSAYGPEEAFRTLGEHTYLAVALAALMAITVFVLSFAYSRIIEYFPHGGGGYVVATKLLGERYGVVSGCALLVDYVLTIAISIAAAGDAMFSFLPIEYQGWKLPVEVFFILALTTLNIRGVKESVIALTPVFLLFLVMHALLIGVGIVLHAGKFPEVANAVTQGFRNDLMNPGLGIFGILALFFHAYSLGGGTYTGIEAVSNGMAMMRAPAVHTARRTMLYMATSLAFTAAGLIVCYLLWEVRPAPGKTYNAVLVESVVQGFPMGGLLVVLTLGSEAALLVVAAQAGFLDGPRVLSYMAVDSWAPHRFAALSERLTTQNGIVLMGAASLAALFFTQGHVSALVVMYSINVFLTFSLSMLGMFKFSIGSKKKKESWKRNAALFGAGLVMCATILLITIIEKFGEGGWKTLAITGACVVLCILIHRHYRLTTAKLGVLDKMMEPLPDTGPASLPDPDPMQPTAAVLVASYEGLGIHTLLNIFRSFPGVYKNLVFLSVGVVDSGRFKGEEEIEALQAKTEENLKKYVDLARRLGIPATYRTSIGTDVVHEAEILCQEVAKEFPRITFFAGQVIFQRERWYHRFLHNQTVFALQKRLQWASYTMVILPVRVRETS